MPGPVIWLLNLAKRLHAWVLRQFRHFRDTRHWYLVARQPVKHPVICDVVIACGENDQRFLAESIRSIRNQSFAHCFIHVCFDGSTPDAIIKEFPEVRFYRTSKPVGPFRIANELTRFCQSGYIAIQDADDIALPTRIWEAVTSLMHTGKGFYGARMEQFCDHRHANADLILRLQANPWHQSGASWHTCPEGALINGTLVFSKERFEGINGYGDLFCSGDDDLNNRLNFTREKKVISTRVVSLRRLHDQGMTASLFAQGTFNRDEVDKLVMARLKALRSGTQSPVDLGSLRQHLADPQVEEIYPSS